MRLLSLGALKRFIPLLLVMLAASGCTSYQLQRNTLAQGRTWTEIQYEMVLDNIAMFREAPNSLPWHITLSQGSTAVSDSIMPMTTHTFPTIAHTFGISGSRLLQDNWTVIPVSDEPTLRNLRRVYQNNRGESWIHDGAGAPGSFGGHFRSHYVWVSFTDADKLADLTFSVLKKGEVPPKPHATPGPLLLPGPVAPLR